MKSKISSKEIKEVVHIAVDKALAECAMEHELMSEESMDSEPMHPYSNSQPDKLSITFTFSFGKNNSIICQPKIDLSQLYK